MEKRVTILTVRGATMKVAGGTVLKELQPAVRGLSGQRLTVGLALGGWPEDHAAVGPTALTLGKQMDDMLRTMRRAWAGEFSGASGPMPATATGVSRQNTMYQEESECKSNSWPASPSSPRIRHAAGSCLQNGMPASVRAEDCQNAICRLTQDIHRSKFAGC